MGWRGGGGGGRDRGRKNQGEMNRTTVTHKYNSYQFSNAQPPLQQNCWKKKKKVIIPLPPPHTHTKGREGGGGWFVKVFFLL